MICYKDMTFCNYYKDCKNSKDCSRCLTDEVKSGAVKWWGSEDAPISIYMEKPDCFEEQ